MSGSTCNAARETLLALIAADSRVEADRVFWSFPGDAVAGGDCIYGVGFEAGESTDISMKAGRRRREEEYNVLIGVAYTSPGVTQRAASDRALTLLTIVQEVVADNPTLTGITLDADQQLIGAEEDSWESAEGPNASTGHGSAFVIKVKVKARLL